MVLSWLWGNPWRFKTFVGNWVSEIINLVSYNHWRHVSGTDSPLDSASRGMYPDESVQHDLWWDGPNWLREPEFCWPTNSASLHECAELSKEWTLTSRTFWRPLKWPKLFHLYVKITMYAWLCWLYFVVVDCIVLQVPLLYCTLKPLVLAGGMLVMQCHDMSIVSYFVPYSGKFSRVAIFVDVGFWSFSLF